MPDTQNNAAFDLRYHLVLVTKYRRGVMTDHMLIELKTLFAKLLVSWRCELIEFGGETDHVHLLIKAHPAMDLSKLVNNLKTISSRTIRQRHKTRLVKFYRKPVFWHGAYYIGSVGNASLETVKRYVENQGS